MPFKIQKVRNKNCYKVVNTQTKKLRSKCTTKQNAHAQMRILKKFKSRKHF